MSVGNQSSDSSSSTTTTMIFQSINKDIMSATATTIGI
jgi:hypothetical protein